MDKKGCVPLVVGVTGHRDVRQADLARLQETLSVFFQTVARVYPHTPLVLLSPLAEGADRIVAGVAMETLGDRLDLIVPMPMPEAHYREDFDAASRQAFEQLKAKARRVFVVPWDKPLDVTGQDRDAAYEAVGRYVARNSHVLLALWDGKDTHLRGGTAAIVRYALAGDPKTPPLQEPETATVIHCVVGRNRPGGEPESGLVPGTIRVQVPGDARHPGWQAVGDLAAFIADERLDPQQTPIIRQFDDYNRSVHAIDAKRLTQSDHSLPPDLQILQEAWASADTLANVHSGRYRHFLKTVIAFSVAAIATFESYDNLWTTLPMLLLYFGFSGLAYGVYRLERRHRHQSRYLDYRALAEGLRVQCYWSHAGLARNSRHFPERVSDYYLTTHKSELAWIRKAIAAILATLDPQALLQRSAQDRQAALQSWVQDQSRYFNRATPRQDALHHRFARRSIACLRLSFGFGLLLLIYECLHLRHHLLHGALIVGVTISALFAGACEAYADRLAPKRQLRQNERMRHIFQKAATLANDQAVDSEALLFDLGQEALQENATWVEIHRERPIEVLHG